MTRTPYFITVSLVAVLLATASTVHAQVRFKVLAVRGSVTVKSTQVKLGQQLKTGDKVVVTGNGYASLAHVNGRTVEIRKAGTFDIVALDKAASKKTGTATDKFAAYVLSELTDVQEPVSFTKARRTNMKTTGSVDRAAGDDVNLWDSVLASVGAPGELQALAAVQDDAIASGSEFSVIMPRYTRLLNDTVRFAWHRTPKAKGYRLVIVDSKNDIAYSREYTDTQCVVALALPTFKRGQTYYWHVEDVGNPGYRTSEYALYQLDGAERTEAETLLAQLREDLDPQEAAIGMLILASAEEEMGLAYDAYYAFAAAVRAEPDVTNYKRLYAEFLLRQGLNAEAYEVYK